MRGFSPRQREEVIEIRETLEQLAIRHACRAMSPDDVDQLRLGLMRQRRAAQAGNEEDFIELDEEFHLSIARGAGLPLVFKLLGQLRGFVRLMRIGTVRGEGYLFRVLEEHEAIVDAVEHRDEAAAAAALSRHLHTVDYAPDPAPSHGGGRRGAARPSNE